MLIDSNPFHIDLIQTTHKGMISIFEVTLDIFIVTLKVVNLNMDVNTSKEDKKGEGGFGEVYEKSMCSGKFMSKVQYAENGTVTRKDLNDVLIEVAFMKIGSLF